METGYFVLGTYVSQYDKAFIEALETDDFKLIQVDSTDAKAVKLFASYVKETFGSVSVVVNNAGVVRDNLLMRMSEEDFDVVLDVNLKGAFNIIKAFPRQLLRDGNASIVNITSVIGLVGNVGQSNYAASKAGLIGLSKSLAKEFASRNVRVNCVAPGFIKTDMTDSLDEKVKEEILKTIALNTFGDVEDVANAVGFLVSDQAKYITGQTLNVCGGMVL